MIAWPRTGALAVGLVSVALGFWAPPAQAADPVLAAAGDIACNASDTSSASTSSCQQHATAALIKSLDPSLVAALGDEQYASGTLEEFNGLRAYNDTWGAAFKPLTRPVAGNHEYETVNAEGYFDYFGALAGNRPGGYYSYDLGRWHIVALDSNCGDDTSGCTARGGSGGTATAAETSWLRADLSAHSGQCTLAYWHHPLFSVGPEGASAGTQPLWDALYAHGADVVLNGHEHLYERYAQLDGAGKADPSRGIREIVVGTGGYGHLRFSGTPDYRANAVESHDDTHFGALFATLAPGSYTFQWRGDTAGFPVLDASPGSVPCHEPQAAPQAAPSTPTTGQPVSFTANATVPDSAISGAQIAGYDWDFGDGSAHSTEASPAHAYAAAGRYTVTLVVTDTHRPPLMTTSTTTINVASPPPPGGPRPGAPSPSGSGPLARSPSGLFGPSLAQPKLSLRALTSRLSRVRRKGLRVRIASSAAGLAQLHLDLLVSSGHSAKRSRFVRIGVASIRLAGRGRATTTTLRLGPQARRLLSRRASATVVVTVDFSGSTRQHTGLSMRLTLRR